MIYAEKIENYYRQKFVEKVREIAAKLEIMPEWLMVVMNSESGLNPRAKNVQNGKVVAVGLIQFIKPTAEGLGTTMNNILQMSILKQLDLVYAYYKPYKNRISSYEDLYIMTFYPYALGKKDSYVIGSEKSYSYARLVAEQNKVIDLNKDGYVTLGEFKKWVNSRFPEEVKKELDQSKRAYKYMKRNVVWLLIPTAIIAGSLFLHFKYGRK